ncbi:MAG: ethanolamine utilization protein EutN [Gammaproteobacteria bacterium]|nr:ethanolamine utilization protein EutN [Gammaproteobacteria bacterium]MYI89526.1 ethanolamine utilization protein EutN [Gammaproteobacteria bacterium]
MKVGKVMGKIWATRKLDELPNGALLEIDLIEDGKVSERVLAYDPLGAGTGEQVLITQGSVAKGWFESGDAVIDALVIGIVDEEVGSKK